MNISFPPLPESAKTCFRILVADDEALILAEYERVLAGDHQANADQVAVDDLEAELFGQTGSAVDGSPQYKVTLCASGEDAVAAVGQAVRDDKPFSLAFLDIRMPPGIDGVTAAEQMRVLDPHLQIVFVTGYSDVSPNSLTARVSKPEATLFFQKPLHVNELRQMAYSLCEKWSLERELCKTYGYLRQLMETAPVVIYSASLDPDNQLSFISEYVAALFGYRPVDCVGNRQFWQDMVHPDDREQVRERLQRAAAGGVVGEREYRLRLPDGSYRWVADRVRILRDVQGRPEALVGCWVDITDRRHAEKRIFDLAFFDELTGLPNRAFMKVMLRQAIEAAQRNSKRLAVLFLDLDQFKQVNDSLGHSEGDELLREVANRLLKSLRRSDCIGRISDEQVGADDECSEKVMRLGGDEFIVLLPEIENRDEASLVAERIAQKLSRPVDLGAEKVNVTASIGISVYPDDAASIEALLKNADMAMYQAKISGRGQHAFFSDEMSRQALSRFCTGRDLHRALERQEFEVKYQPRISLRTREVTGVEALIRWQHPEKGVVSPAEFIPVAEDLGLIVPIGEWVLREACRNAVAMERAGLTHFTMGVNLSGVQLRQKQLAKTIDGILRETEFDPRRLELELTESVLMEDTRISASLLSELREIGVKVSVDDFGTGYSSLNYLKRFPLNALKIDKSFVQALPDDHQDAAIVGAMISLAQQLQLAVVAEGVERWDQLAFLRGRGCDEAQGYYFSPPLALADLEHWIRGNRRIYNYRPAAPVFHAQTS